MSKQFDTGLTYSLVGSECPIGQCVVGSRECTSCPQYKSSDLAFVHCTRDDIAEAVCSTHTVSTVVAKSTEPALMAMMYGQPAILQAMLDRCKRIRCILDDDLLT